MKEMVGGCCVCSDDRGWTENPLVYCDGPSCTVAVHQACYGIVTVPTGNWYCRKCESQERSTKVRCELCPNKDGALKPTDNNAWAHVVCALYIPEVRFGNVTTMEPIILQQIPQERYNKTCYICDENSRTASRSTVGACMQCNKAGCRQTFHVTCAQAMGLLCEEAGNYMDNVKYCGYCHHHYTKIKKRGNVKVIPPYRPIGANDSPGGSPIKETEPIKTTSKRKLSSTSSGKSVSKSATPVDEISLVNTFDSKSGLSSSNQELSQNEDSSTSQTSQSATNGSKRRKAGGARTPPTTNTTALSGVSPDASPRPITPLTNSVGSVAPVGTVIPGVVTTTPVGQTNRPSNAGSMFGNSITSSNSEKRQSGVVKEVRPNSILVNVPLDAAMMPNSPNISTSSGNTSNTIVGSGVASTSNIVSSVSPLMVPHGSTLSPPISTTSSQLTSSEQGTNLQPSQQQQQQQQQPVKRSSRSQSSEKSDKGRRSSKRSSNSSSGTAVTSNSNNVSNCVPNSKPSISPPLQNSLSHNNTAQSMVKVDETHQSTPPPPPLTSAVQMNNHVNDVSNTSSGSRGRRSNSNSSVNATIKEEKDIKIMQTAGLNAAHMLGNQLNPTSAMAQKMCDTLSQEMVAHSVFNSEPATNHLVGPQLIKFQPPRLNNGSSTNLSNGSGSGGSSSVSAIAGNTSSTGGNNHGWGQTNMPQTLEQLLERQWEQGSQFLMEQAQHFDIASLLSCLHQLRAENHQLEEHVNSLIQRRDHLLAVNARLAIPLVPNVSTAPSGTDRTGSGSSSNASNSVPQPTSANTPPVMVSAQGAAIVENGLPDSPRHDYLPSTAPPPPVPPSSSMRQIRQQGGNSIGGQSQNNTGGYQPSQNSVLVRTTSVDPSRRSSHSPATSVFSSNSSSMYSHSTVAQSQQLAQQPQVVIRRDVISELSHHTGSVASSQPPTLVPANQSLGSGGGGSGGGGGGGGTTAGSSGGGGANANAASAAVPPSSQSQQQQQQQQPVVATRPS
uniref:Putative phd finger protein af10 n=1 Tax=Triatoma infestans TaxID=30076 RepID=A0A023EZ33_TRIIF